MNAATDLSPKALVVDDDVLHMDAIADLLELEGPIETLRANHPADALDLFARFRESIAVAVVDLDMPGIGGEGLIMELSRSERPPQILLVTGAYDYARRTRNLLGCVKRVLPKPCDCATLLAMVRAAASSWKPLAEAAA